MRKTLWSVLALLFAALVVAPNAYADSYTYSFVGQGNYTGTSFTIVDPTGPISLYSYIPYPGEAATLNPGAVIQINDGLPAIQIFLIQPYCEVYTDGTINNCEFAIIDVDERRIGINFPTLAGFASVGEYTAADVTGNGGVLDITSTATPEPSSVVLMLAGIGLVLMLRKLMA